MATHPLHHHDTPDEGPAEMPVEPDQGPTPPTIPEDPEHDRIVDPMP